MLLDITESTYFNMRPITGYGALMGALFVSSTFGYVLDSNCYGSPGSGAESQGKDTYQSQGECHKKCLKLGSLLFALKGGDTCFCSDALPGDDDIVADSQCNADCNGYPDHNCGGRNAYKIGYTGIDGGDTSNFPVEDDSNRPSSSTTSSTSTVSGESVVVTATGSETPTEESSSGGGGSKAGIAAGVVVGVIALIALCVGAFLIIRRKRRLQAEEEYRNAVSTKEFVSSIRKPAADARLDPVMLQQRRLSDGSIADNQDYSRRILKVTNPDNS